VLSPLAAKNAVANNVLQNQLLLISPEQMIFSPTQLDSQGLISPTLVAFDNREKLQLQMALQEQKKQLVFPQNCSLMSSQMSSKKNSAVIGVKGSQAGAQRMH